MKSILFRSIGVSFVLLCLSLSALADGEMGTGSKTDKDNTGGLTSNTTIELKTGGDCGSTTDSGLDFYSWIAKMLTEVLG